jgi:hypothetical protein
MKHFTSEVRRPTDDDALEWQPDVERLQQEINAALASGQTDHLAVAEAECWIDLIDAELSARRGRTSDTQLSKLRLWRHKLAALVQRARTPTIEHA